MEQDGTENAMDESDAKDKDEGYVNDEGNGAHIGDVTETQGSGEDHANIEGSGLSPGEGMVEPAGRPGENAVAEGPGSQLHETTIDSRCVRAMEEEFEKHKSRRLQQWEDAVMAEAMGQCPQEAGIKVEIRGSIHNNQGRGTSQTMCFGLRPGEDLELRFSVKPYPQGHLSKPEG